MTKRLQRAVSGARSGGLRAASSGLIDLDLGTATLSSNAATINTPSGVLTTESLTTAAAGTQALTITNSLVTAASIVIATLQGGTSTNGIPIIDKVVPAAGSFVATVRNIHASAALNGTLKVGFFVIK